MKCEDLERLEQAYIDQELDAAHSEAFAAHLAGCPDCEKRLTALTSLSQAIKTQATHYALPAGLSDKIAGRRIIAPAAKGQAFKWGAFGGGLAMAACLALFMLTGPSAEHQLEQQLVTSHIRSLQDGHLIDVASTDQHTVKPWFNGRLDMSPPVVDLKIDGFPLIGGRLDYVDRHTAAVIIYKYNAHVINLFVWPSTNTIIARPGLASQQGYHMRHWQSGDLTFWAISDVNPAKLAEFENLYRDQTK